MLRRFLRTHRAAAIEIPTCPQPRRGFRVRNRIRRIGQFLRGPPLILASAEDQSSSSFVQSSSSTTTPDSERNKVHLGNNDNMYILVCARNMCIIEKIICENTSTALYHPSTSTLAVIEGLNPDRNGMNSKG